MLRRDFQATPSAERLGLCWHIPGRLRLLFGNNFLTDNLQQAKKTSFRKLVYFGALPVVSARTNLMTSELRYKARSRAGICRRN